MADDPALTRRRFVHGSALAAAAVVLEACGGESEESRPGDARRPRAARPTPACADGDEPTVEQTEGPFYTPDTPRRTDLRAAGVRGEPLLLTGAVVDTRCRPMGRALLDFWQADAEGEYDNDGFRLRGHQFTDARGRFRLSTVVPGLYAGRTRHIHVKVQRRGGSALTTQLYFPGEPENRDDGIFNEALVMAVRREGGRRRARFDFVLA